MTLQIIASIVLLIFLFKVWTRWQDRSLSFVQALLWSLVWLAVGLVFWQPEITSRLAIFFGIGRGADLIVYVAIIVLAYICFRIFVKIDKLDRQLTKLVKEIALNDQEKSRHTDSQL